MSTAKVFLHIDDEPADAYLLRRAFRKANPYVDLLHVHDGQEAIAYLLGEGHFGNRSAYPMPAAVLLDLKMPIMDGFEFFEWFRAQQTLQDIPVFILSSSSLPEDQSRAFALGAQDYFVKSALFMDVVGGVLNTFQMPGQVPCYIPPAPNRFNAVHRTT